MVDEVLLWITIFHFQKINANQQTRDKQTNKPTTKKLKPCCNDLFLIRKGCNFFDIQAQNCAKSRKERKNKEKKKEELQLF